MIRARVVLPRWRHPTQRLRATLERAGRTSVCLALLTFVPGCFIVQGRVPHGANVNLLPAGVPVEFTYRYQKWYAAWGIFPLSSGDTPAEIIAREKLVEARVLTEDSFEDFFSGIIFTFLFPTGIVLSQTVVVEGNREPVYYGDRAIGS